jgi:mRNA interferase MazF
VSYRTYLPKRGDLVHMNFSPSAGHEMTGRHYALVISHLPYSRESGMAIVCVITSRIRGYPYEVPVPKNLLPPKKGVGEVSSVVIADSIRQVDYREREIEPIGTAPESLVEEVLDRLLTALEEH